MRAFLAGSSPARAFCVLLLALFLVLCGLHVAGSDHDDHADTVVADGLALIVVVVVMALLAVRVTRRVVTHSLAPANWSSAPPSRPPTTALVSEAPLRC